MTEIQITTEHFFGQFYAGMAASLAVIDQWDSVFQNRTERRRLRDLFDAIVKTAPDLGELIQASERRGEYRLTKRLRLYQIRREQQEA